MSVILRRFATWDSCLAARPSRFSLPPRYGRRTSPATSICRRRAAGVSEKALLVLPLVLLIIAREIDLSVASILALTSVVLGVLIRADVPLFRGDSVVTLAGAMPAPSTVPLSRGWACRRSW